MSMRDVKKPALSMLTTFIRFLFKKPREMARHCLNDLPSLHLVLCCACCRRSSSRVAAGDDGDDDDTRKKVILMLRKDT